MKNVGLKDPAGRDPLMTFRRDPARSRIICISTYAGMTLRVRRTDWRVSVRGRHAGCMKATRGGGS
jgi:hypothetical protein